MLCIAALSPPKAASTYMSVENLSKSFDSVRISQLGAALQKLQAPQDLFNHVHALHNQHSPIFSVHGVVGQEWSQVKRGLAQGCPFSALLGAAVVMVWCCNIAQAGGDSVCFIDDRVTLNSSGKVLKETQTCPRSFDECFGFVCNPVTSRVASKPDNAEAAAVADRVTYRHRCRPRPSGHFSGFARAFCPKDHQVQC